MGRDADHLPVHELDLRSTRGDEPSAKQRKRKDPKETIDATPALAARLVKEERPGLRQARGGGRVRLYLEAFTRRQERPAGAGKNPSPRVKVEARQYDDTDLLTAGVARRRTRPKSKRKKKEEAQPAPEPSRSPSWWRSPRHLHLVPRKILPIVRRSARREEARDGRRTRCRQAQGLVELYAKSPDRPLSAADADELNQLEKRRGSEGAAKDRQAAKRLLRPLRGAQKGAEVAERLASCQAATRPPSLGPGAGTLQSPPAAVFREI